MPRKKALVLTDHELRLMNVLWAKGPATVSEVTAALTPPNLAYNTVLSTLRTLEQKGYVAHRETGRAFTFRPLVERDDAARSAVNHVLARFFHNSPHALAVTLLDDVPLREADRKQIREMLERKTKART
ncbi:MAG: BlaI/MecI/CopY family transcriptional regulator [Candidatus Eremiobacteraeota bacterium]|nr:BlaI/MecI/CopY family transcriptional regulator [Candidatus Eremiobacteraeota bacterium]